MQLAVQNVADGGKPFGAVVVANGHIVATGVNEVHKTGDLTTHAEMQAIRAAAHNGKARLLKGATMYASGHPCPMCLAAIYLAGFAKICYHYALDEMAGTQLDVTPVYQQLKKPFDEQQIPLLRLQTTVRRHPVREWLQQQKEQ